MYELDLNLFTSLAHSFFSNMAAYRVGFEDEHDEDSCMPCLDTTKYRCLRYKFPLCNKCFPEEKRQNSRLESWKVCWIKRCRILFKSRVSFSIKERLLREFWIILRRRCFHSLWSKGSIFTVSFTKERALFWARACLLYMHESSLLTYLHIPLSFSQSASL